MGLDFGFLFLFFFFFLLILFLYEPSNWRLAVLLMKEGSSDLVFFCFGMGNSSGNLRCRSYSRTEIKSALASILFTTPTSSAQSSIAVVLVLDCWHKMRVSTLGLSPRRKSVIAIVLMGTGRHSRGNLHAEESEAPIGLGP